MTTGITDVSRVHFKTGKAGRQCIANGAPPSSPTPPPARVPRVARLMALAIHFDGLIRKGVVRDYADLARLGGVTRARVTQIMNLLNLPPWRQEEILFLPGAESGREAVTERDLRAVVAQINWQMQRSLL